MTELRITGRSEDGTHLLLTDFDNHEFSLRISDSLRATINQPRLASVRVDQPETMSVREIQARLRAGADMEDLAREADLPFEKIERFASPILQERAYILSLANNVVIRKSSNKDSLTFIEVVQNKLVANGVSLDKLDWNTHRREDGTWVIKLAYPNSDGHGDAIWLFDLQKRNIDADDEGSAWILGVEEKPAEQISHGLVPSTVTISTAPTPRLSVIRENEDASDGVTKRASIPSWDEIMFGKKDDQE